VAAALAAQLPCRDAAQLVVDQRQDRDRRLAVSVAPLLEQLVTEGEDRSNLLAS